MIKGSQSDANSLAPLKIKGEKMTDCDNQIKYATDRKVELQAKIDEAEKVLAE